MSSLIVSAIAKWNGAALKKGQKDLTAFQKTTLSLGKTFASVFAAQKIYQFGKASVKAFMADEKAAKSLEIALKNTGNGFATLATEGFISRMQQTYKVLDDELRPAFQTLLTSTGSVTKAQEGLQLALDISAGTTKDLASVSAALAKGYAGNTAGLSKLNAGLSKAILKTGDMEKITAALTARFQGQALGSLDTYSKKFDALSIAAANSKEILGKGVLDALDAIGGGSTQNGIAKTTSGMEKLATAAAKFGVNFSTGIGQGLALLRGDLSTFKSLGEAAAKKPEQKAAYSSLSMYMTTEAAERAKVVKTLKDQNAEARKAAQLKAAEKNLDELKKKFDIDRINLETALLNSKDDAERARIKGLIAIMDEDKDAAAARIAEIDRTESIRLQGLLDTAKAEEKARTDAANNIKNLGDAAAKAAAMLSTIGNPAGNYTYSAAAPSFVFGAGSVPDIPKTISNAADMGNPNGIYDYSSANPSFTYSPPLVQNITIEAPNGSEEYLTDAVKRALQKLNRYGDSTTFAGAL
jgi:hypothetical protein